MRKNFQLTCFHHGLWLRCCSVSFGILVMSFFHIFWWWRGETGCVFSSWNSQNSNTFVLQWFGNSLAYNVPFPDCQCSKSLWISCDFLFLGGAFNLEIICTKKHLMLSKEDCTWSINGAVLFPALRSCLLHVQRRRVGQAAEPVGFSAVNCVTATCPVD